MPCVHLGNQQRNVGIHAMVLRVADDGITGAREVLFGGPGHGRIERGENEIASETRVQAFDDEPSSNGWNRDVEETGDPISVTLTKGTLPGSDFGVLEPTMIGQEFSAALIDECRGAKK